MCKLADAGNYTVVATNAAGSVGSNVATLSVNVAPAFTTQPQNSSVFLGGAAASFTVVATGGPTPTLQWQRLPAGSGTWADLANGGAYAGVTTATVTITGATLVMSGDQFRCVATNTVNTATSNAATLTVVVPLPVISIPPASQAALLGTTVNFSVTVNSPVSVTYQWQKGGVDLGGATASTYSIASFASGDVGSYTVTVTNSAGPVTSAAATLAIALPPVITTDPAPQTVILGSPASFAVAVTSNTTPSYVWRKNDVAIPGATNATYGAIARVAQAHFDAANYSGRRDEHRRQHGDLGEEAALTVQLPPTITQQQPADQQTTAGATVTFTVAASRHDQPVLPMAAAAGRQRYLGERDRRQLFRRHDADARHRVSQALANSGDQFRCVVTNVAGAVTSIGTLRP